VKAICAWSRSDRGRGQGLQIRAPKKSLFLANEGLPNGRAKKKKRKSKESWPAGRREKNDKTHSMTGYVIDCCAEGHATLDMGVVPTKDPINGLLQKAGGGEEGKGLGVKNSSRETKEQELGRRKSNSGKNKERTKKCGARLKRTGFGQLASESQRKPGKQRTEETAGRGRRKRGMRVWKLAFLRSGTKRFKDNIQDARKELVRHFSTGRGPSLRAHGGVTKTVSTIWGKKTGQARGEVGRQLASHLMEGGLQRGGKSGAEETRG